MKENEVASQQTSLKVLSHLSSTSPPSSNPHKSLSHHLLNPLGSKRTHREGETTLSKSVSNSLSLPPLLYGLNQSPRDLGLGQVSADSTPSRSSGHPQGVTQRRTLKGASSMSRRRGGCWMVV